MVLFKDKKLAQKAKHLTTQAKVPHHWEFVHDEVVHNYRMPNINAALGLAQLEQLPRFIESKRKITIAYKDFIKQLNDSTTQPINFITEPKNAKSNYWLNTVLLGNNEQSNNFLKYINERVS